MRFSPSLANVRIDSDHQKSSRFKWPTAGNLATYRDEALVILAETIAYGVSMTTATYPWVPSGQRFCCGEYLAIASTA